MIKQTIHILLSLLFVLLISCTQVVELDGLGNSNDLETANDSDNYNGDSGDTVDSGGDTGNTADTSDTANTGNTADTGDTLDSGNTADTADTANTSDTGNTADDSTIQDDSEFPDIDMTNPSSFPDDFNLSQCECGIEPQHEPVCCNKTVSVYNICFANCFAHYSNAEKMLCDEYVETACAPSENLFPDQDTLFDEDASEQPDEDTIIISDSDTTILPDEDTEASDSDSAENCECYPDDFQAWCCNDGIVYISKCLADCHCSRNYILCPSQ